MQKITVLLLLSFPMLLYGQQAVLSSGGEATGTGGTSSYSVGQISYIYNGSAPSMDEGVQQPFEVTILPVELLYFKAEVLKGSDVELTWETAIELNNDYFTIERSQGGRDWEYLEKVSGAGTTTFLQNYSYVDEAPYRGISYYRLKQTDFDGSFSYSEIRSVRISYGAISIYPTPVKDYLTLETEAYPLGYEISDISGKLLKSGVLDDSQRDLDMSGLPSGVFTIRLESGGETLLTQKLMKL